MPGMISDLVCPLDGSGLDVDRASLSCPRCGRIYPRDGKVVRFMDHDDPFYEGTYNNEVKFLPAKNSLFYELPLWIITNGYEWAVRKYVEPGSRIMEIGCAGGVAWFGARYEMIGADLSRRGLEIASRKYGLCLQLNARQLPIENGYLDAVISSYFWEHIAAEEKKQLLAEFRRVLRPGGHVIFVYDVETANPVVNVLRRKSPQLYRQLFLEHDGHIGYQTLEENNRLFKENGYRIIESVSMERSPLQSPDVYQKMARWPGSLGSIGQALAKANHRKILAGYLTLLRLVDESFGRLLPPTWGRIARTVATKI